MAVLDCGVRGEAIRTLPRLAPQLDQAVEVGLAPHRHMAHAPGGPSSIIPSRATCSHSRRLRSACGYRGRRGHWLCGGGGLRIALHLAVCGECSPRLAVALGASHRVRSPDNQCNLRLHLRRCSIRHTCNLQHRPDKAGPDALCGDQGRRQSVAVGRSERISQQAALAARLAAAVGALCDRSESDGSDVWLVARTARLRPDHRGRLLLAGRRVLHTLLGLR